MPCRETTEEKQSEFEFFQQLTTFPDPKICCGPKVLLGFAGPALNRLHEVVAALGLDSNYLDTYEATLLESGVLLITMCSRHWMKHSEAITTAAIYAENDSWVGLAYYIYTFMCTINQWDYKEITNYTKTANFLKEKD